MKTKPIPETVKVEVNIKPGPVSPSQKQAWKRFWKKLLCTKQEAPASAASTTEADKGDGHHDQKQQ